MARFLSLLVSLGLSSATFYAGQNTTRRPPVIDMHVHLDPKSGPATMDRLNVRYAFLAVHPAALRDWAQFETMANRYLPAVGFPCPGGDELFFGRFTCFETGTEFPDVAWLRGRIGRSPRSSISRSAFTWDRRHPELPTPRVPCRDHTATSK